MKNIEKINFEKKKVISEHLFTLSKEYFNLTDEELIKKIDNCMTTVNKEWENKKDILSFYEESKEYLFGLIPFNSINRIEKVIFPIKYHTGCDILDFGAGIGEIGMCFSRNNNVYYYDIAKESQKFAKFISEKTDRKLTFLKEEEVFTKKYLLATLVNILLGCLLIWGTELKEGVMQIAWFDASRILAMTFGVVGQKIFKAIIDATDKNVKTKLGLNKKK